MKGKIHVVIAIVLLVLSLFNASVVMAETLKYIPAPQELPEEFYYTSIETGSPQILDGLQEKGVTPIYSEFVEFHKNSVTGAIEIIEFSNVEDAKEIYLYCFNVHILDMLSGDYVTEIDAFGDESFSGFFRGSGFTIVFRNDKFIALIMTNDLDELNNSRIVITDILPKKIDEKLEQIKALTPTPNSPPNTPSRPSGSSSGYTKTTYTYSTSATDPDGDKVQYRFDWGDGTVGSWTLFVVYSGESVSKSHSWIRPGTYYVKAQAKDTQGATSSWSSAKAVTIYTPTPRGGTHTPTSTITQTPTPIITQPNESITSEIKPLKLIYYVDVDKPKRELIIDVTLENIGNEAIRDVYVQMETSKVLQRVSVLNAIEKTEGLYIGDLNPQDSQTITQRFKLTGEVEGDLRIPVTVKASGSAVETILVIIIVISEALLKLLQYGIIPMLGVGATFAAFGIVYLLVRQRRKLWK